MGESKLRMAKPQELRKSLPGVQTVAGRVQVRWESASAATPMVQLASPRSAAMVSIRGYGWA